SGSAAPTVATFPQESGISRGRLDSTRSARSALTVSQPATRTQLLICGLLTLLTLAVYAQVCRFPFISIDDGIYVTANPIVQNGLSAGGFVWALHTLYGGNWHPLTWLSHMAAWQLFHDRAGFHHA